MNIYQLKIELKDSNPKIWRRIQIAEDTSFSDLHDIIQITMGWENEHLFEFNINGIRIHDFEGEFDDGSDPTKRDSMDTYINDLVNLTKSKFSYIYDFGDNWEHDILVEKIIPAVKDFTYPICLEGERACPPEDCGGIWGYLEILKILSDTNHPQYEETLSWLGEEWNAEMFNCEHTNVILVDYAEQWEEIYKETGEFLDGLEEDDYEDDEIENLDFEFNDDEIEDEKDDVEGILRPLFNPLKPITKEKTPGRNDPCLCGSGKKYKKCCMNREN